jgi:hypothetical protein
MQQRIALAPRAGAPGPAMPGMPPFGPPMASFYAAGPGGMPPRPGFPGAYPGPRGPMGAPGPRGPRGPAGKKEQGVWSMQGVDMHLMRLWNIQHHR